MLQGAGQYLGSGSVKVLKALAWVELLTAMLHIFLLLPVYGIAARRNNFETALGRRYKAAWMDAKERSVCLNMLNGNFLREAHLLAAHGSGPGPSKARTKGRLS